MHEQLLARSLETLTLIVKNKIDSLCSNFNFIWNFRTFQKSKTPDTAYGIYIQYPGTFEFFYNS